MTRYLIAVVALLFMAGFALAQGMPGPEIDPGAAGKGLVGAITGGQWGLVIGFGVMLIVWILRVFVWPNVNPKALPWIAIAIASLGTFSVAMASDPSKWLGALIAGVQAGLAAAGTWGVMPGKIKKATEKAVAKRANGA